MTLTEQKILFLSDAHLGGFSKTQNQQIESSLLQLIDYCEHHSYRIFILGDLFDYWMEYPSHVPALGQTLLRRFSEYNREVGSSLFITGNHDNWTRGHFEAVGFEVEPDYRAIPLDSRNVLLLHGDGLLDEDKEITRPLMHRLLRNSSFVRWYQKILPAKAGLKLMKYFSRFNRYFEAYRSDIKKMNKWAELQLKTSELDVIICGHDHMPRMKNFSFGTFINLGTFYRHRTLAVYNKGKFSLVVWDDVARELKTFDPEKHTL